MPNFTPIQANSFTNFINRKWRKAVMKHESLSWRANQGLQSLSISRCSKCNCTKNLGNNMMKYSCFQTYKDILKSFIYHVNLLVNQHKKKNVGANLSISTRKE